MATLKQLDMTKKNENDKELTLQEIREALKDVDERRKDTSLTDDEREVMELSAVALRDAERLLIAKKQKALVKEMEAGTAELNKLAKQIRAKVKKMNTVPKGLDKIEAAVKVVVRIVSAVAKLK